MTEIEFRPAAAKDLEEAAEWYETQQSGLGGEFLDAVRATLNAILENPKQFPMLYRDTRRALIRRFPYGIYFRVMLNRALVVARACTAGGNQPVGGRADDV